LTTLIENRIRWSGLLIVSGLAVLLTSLVWDSPLSFMGFLALGCPLIVSGILLYLWSLAGRDGSSTTVVVVCLSLSFLLAGCGSDVVTTSKSGTGESSSFDPSTATARVFGKVVLDGTPPERASLNIRVDPFCQKNGPIIFKQGALLTESGALRNVIVYVRSGHEGRSYPVPADPVVLDQQQCVYVPHALTLMKGQKLRVLNSDPTFHNVHAKTTEHTEFNIAQPSKGAEDIQTFTRTGMPYRIGCDLHDWMTAYVGVFEHPFHTATGNTGSYELYLPPGKYEIVAWHEKFGEQVVSVDLSASTAIAKDFHFTVKTPN
jgi:plastocyanin